MLKTFFPRGQGPLVSILLPSRGRPDQLLDSVASLYATAADKTLLEFLLKVDEDDPATVEEACLLTRKFPGSPFLVVVSPRGRGYVDVCDWLQSLAAKSTGDWLFIWDDGARMITPGWDRALLWALVPRPWVGIEEVCYLQAVKYGTGTVCGQQYLLRRGVYELLGHVGRHTTGDDWMGSVMGVIQHRTTLSVEVSHESPGDEIQRNNRILEDTMAQGAAVRREKVRDVMILHDRLERREKEKLKPGPPEPRTWSIRMRDGKAGLYLVNGDGTGEVVNGTGVRKCLIPEGGLWAVVSKW